MSPLAPGISVLSARRSRAVTKAANRLAKAAIMTIVALGLLPVSPAYASNVFGLVPDFPTVQRLGQTLTLTPRIWIVNHGSAPLTVIDLSFLPSCSSWDASCAGGVADPGAFTVGPLGTGVSGTGCEGRVFNLSTVNTANGNVRILPADGRPLTLSAADMATDLDSCRINISMVANRLPIQDSNLSLEGVQTNQIVSITGSMNGQAGTHGTTDTTTVVAPVTPPYRAPADMNNDGRTDIALFRESVGGWYNRDAGTVFWGSRGDIPVPAQYFDGPAADTAVWRPATGQWFFKNGPMHHWGVPEDVPVPGDYDADGLNEVAVWRPSTGQWFLKDAPTYFWGLKGDIPVPADYDGDGDADLAVWRPASGGWFVYGQGTTFWGMPGDIPVPGDYDGDGTADPAVYRPSTGTWWVQGQDPVAWGGDPSDIAAPGDYDGDRDMDIAIYRRTTGQWWIRGQASPVQWGGDPTDVPAAAKPWIVTASN